MQTDLKKIIEIACLMGGVALVGCSSDSDTSSNNSTAADAGCPGKEDGGKGAGCPAAGCPTADAGCPTADGGCPATGNADTPPTTNPAAIDAWLAAGSYKTGTWKCEAEPHAGRAPSPHGQNRVCSNAKLSAHGAGEFPIGSANVKEIYTGANITGLAIALKTAAGAGEAWFWYERLNGSVVANGLGVPGCAGCHSTAPAGPQNNGHDFVFTQVK